TYDGSGAPPLPAKSIQRGRSDPQISFIPQDVSPGLSPRHSSYHASHPSNLQARASPSPPLPGHDGQGSRPPRSPQGPGVTLRGHRQTMSWEGQAVSQNRIGPVSSEKTTSYRRTSSGSQGPGGPSGKCGATSTGGQAGGHAHDEPYCSLLGNGVHPTPAQAQTPSPTPASAGQTQSAAPPAAAATGGQNSSMLTIPPPPRQRRNAMVSGSRPRPKRVKALVDCRAVGSEQLAFFKDEVIVVTATDDLHWWVGHIEGDSSRSGTFPVNYVHKLGD
ncbi:hypothetical protein CRUP_014515, partial [Coryphaenoides rupestris]